MKRETLRHPKTLDLAARLGVDRPTALGYLTLLWDFVADASPRGDIGKWPNGAIARACDYMGDHDAFVASLTDSGWIDENHEHRLIVHDWPDHCERWIKAKLDKLGMDFLSCYDSTPKSTPSSVVDSTVDSIVGSPPRDRTEPNRTYPNLNRPDGGADGGFAEEEPIEVDQEAWDAAVPTMRRIREVVEPSKPLKDRDRELIAMAAITAHQRYGMQWLDEVLSDIKGRREAPRTPWGYFKGALTKSATRSHRDFHAAIRATEIPKELLTPPPNGVKPDAT